MQGGAASGAAIPLSSGPPLPLASALVLVSFLSSGLHSFDTTPAHYCGAPNVETPSLRMAQRESPLQRMWGGAVLGAAVIMGVATRAAVSSVLNPVSTLRDGNVIVSVL